MTSTIRYRKTFSTCSKVDEASPMGSIDQVPDRKVGASHACREYLREKQRRHRIVDLALENAAVARLSLPALHRDPFDRILICQAIQHELTLVTAGDQITHYPVPTLRVG
jgi:PIN domain nuclease of toxin-antitoxin system